MIDHLNCQIGAQHIIIVYMSGKLFFKIRSGCQERFMKQAFW
jgi:hypothetical protein